MADEYKIDFDKLSIANSNFEAGFYNDFVYTNTLEFSGNQEETDKFKYEIMKRAGIDETFKNSGFEIDNFKKFQELQRNPDVELDIVVNYIFDGNGADGLVASGLYGTLSTPFTDLPLNENEKEGYKKFNKEVIEEDFEKENKEWHEAEME